MACRLPCERLDDWTVGGVVVGTRRCGRREYALDALEIGDLRAYVNQVLFGSCLDLGAGLVYLQGGARLDGLAVLVIGDALHADRLIVTIGARAARPDLVYIESVAALDSTGALELTGLPRSLLVFGAGYIGCELAQMFARIGVQDLGATIFRYLTTVEGLKLAAQAFDKDVQSLSCCAS